MTAKAIRHSAIATAKKSSRKPAPGLADDRDVEAVGEQVPEGLDDRQEQDDEAPEHEEVRDAGDVPLEQPHLAEHLEGVRHEAARAVLEPTR
jgi:hypothetical protein